MQSAPLSASLARKPADACVHGADPACASPLIARAATLARLGVRNADQAQLPRRNGGELNAAA